MGTKKFTKGCWVIKPYAPLTCAWTFDSNEMCLGSFIDREEFEANGHLIAAAPALYEEIERDIEYLRRKCAFKTQNDEMLPLLEQEIARKTEILAKARGEYQ